MQLPENHPKHPFSSWYWFGDIDSRPLAIFRIVFSIILLKVALYNLFLARWFYSDQGLLPRNILFDGLVRVHRFSLMDAVGTPWMAMLFFLIWILCLCGMLLGFRTRLMVVLNFIMILSIHERNGFILTGADTAMRVFSFWLMFAPAGQHYSIDAYRQSHTGKGQEKTAFALPIRMLQLQLVIIYIVTAYLKALEPIWQRGEALHYVLQLDSILLLPGSWMREAPEFILTTLTQSTLIVEIAIPVFLLFPFRKWFIGLAFGMAIFLHGGIAAALAIPDFSIVMLAAFVLHFPADWANRIAQRLYSLMQALPGDKRAKRSAYWLSQYASPPTLSYPSRKKNNMMASVLIPLMVAVLWWNALESSRYAADYEYTELPAMPPVIENIIWYTGLWQWWDLFAPLPIQYDGFLIIPGHFENGLSYDLRTKRAKIPEQEIFSRFGPLMRFEKFEENIVRYRDNPILRRWGQYYCNQYNNQEQAIRGTRLATLEIIFIYQNSHAPDKSENPYQRDLLWEHWCYDEYAPPDL